MSGSESGSASVGAISGLTRGAAVLAASGAALSGVLIGVAQPAVSAGAVFGAVMGVAAAMTDAWLTLYVAAYPLQGVSVLGVQAFGFRLSHVFFLVMLLVLLWRTVVRGRSLELRLGFVDALVVSFVVFTILSMAWSPASLSVSAVACAKLVFDLMVFFVLSALVQRDAAGTLLRVALGFAIAFLYMAGVAIYNLTELGFQGLVASIVLERGATGTSGLWRLNEAIASSSLTGAAGRNIIASWMVLGLMLIWGVLSERWRHVARSERLMWWWALAGAACFIVLSLSRTAWLSLALGVLLLWWISGHGVRLRAAVSVLMVSGVLATAVVVSGVGTLLVSRLQAVSSVLDTGITGRLEIWRAVLTQFVAHPLFGVGIKGTEALTLSFTENAANPHNVYVQILAELGLVGAALFALLVGYLVWKLWRAGNVLPVPLRSTAWGLLAAVCCYLVQSLTQAEFMDLGIWTLLGLAAGMARLRPAPAPMRATLGGAG